MENLEFLMPIVGGIIGYFTNWLAIKMIFKPYEEKFLFGKKLPFTPGLMAKERYALSNKIGKTVKKHVLTDEVILDAISHKDFSKIVNLVVDYVVSSEKTFGDYDREYGNKLSEFIKSFLETALDDSLMKEKVATEISGKIFDFIQDENNIKKLEDVASKVYEKVENETNEFGLSLQQDTRLIVEVVQEKNMNKLKGVVEDIMPILLDQIRLIIEKNEGSELDREIGDLIRQIAIDSYGKLATALINPDKIYENSKVNLSKYLKDNERKIIDKTIEFMDKIADKEVKDVVSKVPEQAIKDMAQGGKNVVKEVIGREFDNGKMLIMLNKAVPDMSIRIKEMVYKVLNSFIKDNKNVAIEAVTNKILSIEIKSFGKGLSEIDIDEIKVSVEKTAKDLIRKNGKDIIEGFEIDKLVEDKINTMELEEMENIVISVANKEIKSITIVGGVLGFVIGLIPMITSIISR